MLQQWASMSITASVAIENFFCFVNVFVLRCCREYMQYVKCLIVNWSDPFSTPLRVLFHSSREDCFLLSVHLWRMAPDLQKKGRSWCHKHLGETKSIVKRLSACNKREHASMDLSPRGCWSCMQKRPKACNSAAKAALHMVSGSISKATI